MIQVCPEPTRPRFPTNSVSPCWDYNELWDTSNASLVKALSWPRLLAAQQKHHRVIKWSFYECFESLLFLSLGLIARAVWVWVSVPMGLSPMRKRDIEHLLTWPVPCGGSTASRWDDPTWTWLSFGGSSIFPEDLRPQAGSGYCLVLFSSFISLL